jgi:hypothetical protein
VIIALISGIIFTIDTGLATHDLVYLGHPG